LNQLVTSFLPFLSRWLSAGLLLLLVGLAGAPARAQVLDDSTKVIYGPKTTRLLYEPDILRDSTEGAILDTSLTRWTQARFWYHDTTFQQDLGAAATASRPLLYQPTIQLGARFGRNVFDKYARNAADIPYYDSRSPYSFFRVVQSGEGEQVFEISYSRSLKKNFSIGIAYERFASNKILAASGRAGLVEHSNLLLFGRYQTDNERYHLLFNIGNVRHRASEQGGIRPRSGEEGLRDLFNYERQSVYLTNAQNTEDRDRLHLLQTYRLLGRGLTLYHVFDTHRQYNSYRDAAIPYDDSQLLFYRRVFNNTTNTLDRAEYRQVENTLGVLGRTDRVEYRLYARNRGYGLKSQTASPTSTAAGPVLQSTGTNRSDNESFIGGAAAFNYRKVYAIEAAGEYKFFDEYWLRASARTGPLSAEVLLSSYSPTLTQQEFVGNHYEWHNRGRFDNTNALHFTGRLQQRLPGSDHRFEASGSIVYLNNLVYYDIDGQPTQNTSTDNQLLVLFARHQIRLGRVVFDNQATYTQGGDVSGIRIPKLVSFSRVYYQSYIFRKALFSQVGIETYFQSRYRAFDYSPSTQQFYQQDNFTIRSYPIADVFFVADIKSVSVFLKFAYVNQGIQGDGYFTTPYYTGYPRRFQLGVKWNFFN
jgi:hypothetical protein